MYKKHIKRLFDFIISILVLVILSPIFLLTAVAIKIDSKGPIIFKQKRIGLNGKEFNIYKFRSMVKNAEHTGTGVYSGKEDARVTKVGKIIRATSIDELPQAVNMLKGDMSLIGPRPPLTYHPWPIDEYTTEQKRMFEVRPGLTGWAQVHGRKDVEWNTRIKLNVWYVDNCSFLLDVKIFFMTIFKVLTNADNENIGETVKGQLKPEKDNDCSGMKLMYITNQPDIAMIAENAGVDRIFVDMEYIGKADRQGGMDTVQSHHTIDDIKKIRKILTKSELLVRINPIHEATSEYSSTEEEIEAVIEAGADIIMLPYFKTVEEVEKFIRLVDGRVKTMPLVETPEAVEIIDEILEISGIDEIYIGLNDLSLAYRMGFMFELLADGTVEELCNKFKEKDIPYGFGGIASLGKGALPSEYVIREHYRLGSTRAILGRSFCNTNLINDIDEIKKIFADGLCEIRNLEKECKNNVENIEYFKKNTQIVHEKVRAICGNFS